MKIIEIINTNHIFGFGQISHNPRDYYLNSNGFLYNWLKGEPDAVIRCDGYDINIKRASGFCLQIVTADGWRVNVDKQLVNTASPECCVNAAEEQLRLVELIKNPINKLRARREAAQLTRAQLSELSGIHSQLITKYELGERDICAASYKSVIALANALQCSPASIT